MFERFTDRARAVVKGAQEEARALNHNYIGTEHILLGILREGGGIGGQVLSDVGIELEAVRAQLETITPKGEPSSVKHIPFTPRAKKVLELSLREALQLGHNYIGTEHILLGLTREGEGLAAQMLVSAGVALPDARERVVAKLAGYAKAAGGEELAMPAERRGRRKGRAHADPAVGPRCPGCEESLLATARYELMEVPARTGDGRANVLFLYCSACGEMLDDLILPDER